MSQLLTERQGAVLIVRLRNEPWNFLNGALLGELSDTLARAERDPTVRAVVLASAVPGVFIGHYDIGELLTGAEAGGLEVSPWLAPLPLRVVGAIGKVPGLGGMLDRSRLAGMRALLGFHDLILRIQNSDKAYVAAIDGFALGGGFELALACDVRIIGDGPNKIGLMEAALGLLPGGGGSQLLTRTLGAGRTVELLLEGRLFSPEAAVEAGLVHRVVPQGDVAKHSVDTADRLARRAPGSVRAIKQAVYFGGSSRLSRGLAIERARFLALASRPSTQATLRRYLSDILMHQRTAAVDPTVFIRDCVPGWQLDAATSTPSASETSSTGTAR